MFVASTVCIFFFFTDLQSISDDEYRARLLERQREIDAQLRLLEEELYERRRAMSIA